MEKSTPLSTIDRRSLTAWSDDNLSLLASSLTQLPLATPVCVGPDTSVAQAAAAMQEQDAVLVVVGAQVVGLVTDGDLRRRVLAAGLGADTPIAKVMTKDVISMDANRFLFEALMTMAQHGIGHMVVTKGDGTRFLFGAKDLLKVSAGRNFLLINNILRARAVRELITLAGQLKSLFVSLARLSLAADHLCRITTGVGEAITRRLLVLAEQELGPPPLAYCWLALGSQARAEQTSYSDQDNALVLAKKPINKPSRM